MKLLNEHDRESCRNVWIISEFLPDGELHAVSF